MPYNGGGSFTIPISFASDKLAGITPQADRFDRNFDDIAAGLSTCVTKDGQTTVANDLRWNAKKCTNVGDADDLGDVLNLRSLVRGARAGQSPADGGYTYDWVASGTATAIVAVTNPAFTALVTGMIMTFGAGTDAAAGGTTIAWNGGPSRPILKAGVPIAGRDWLQNDWVRIIYDGTSWHVLSPWHHTDIPYLTVPLFWQAAAPVGYAMVTDAYDHLFRLTDNGAGGTVQTSGGSWSITGLSVIDHSHEVHETSSVPSAVSEGANVAGGLICGSPTHTHTMDAVTFGSGVLSIASAATWRPQYTNVIRAERQ